ncbi:TPA: RtcB family protein [Clostridium botulinum]|nr:RtcB family protein [Clostridium botulinum]HCL4448479.1 RtcB family protein [Clostridium botulinum]HCL4458728.1 RtcB family protein [Clostridium botulinum]HCL4459637.1 RtcB family protein [Clostridium botulinum]HCL4462640.1 RtcB family protein [Clostridium botulinum]
MQEIKGRYNFAKVFTYNIDSETISQLYTLLNQMFVIDSRIRIMPDTHSGKGCVIGTTMTIKDRVVPNLVGVDIGCGVDVIKIDSKKIDFEKLDEVIRKNIPYGMNIHEKAHRFSKNINLEELKCIKHVNQSRAINSIGTLGGGNHFIEVDVDNEGSYYVLIHSGSRYLGGQVAKYYQDLAVKNFNRDKVIKEKEDIIQQLKSQGKTTEIQKALKKLKHPPQNPKDLMYVDGANFNDYIHDMNIIQNYAKINRKAMADIILSNMDWKIEEYFSTIHNYIDIENMILRKGAVSAQKDEKLVIPINMKDGALICIGKGNEEWNFSAPHGAGRIFSRKEAKKVLSLEEFKTKMDGVWTSCVSQYTLDEAPMVYKPIDEIMKNIIDTVDIIDVVKPVYNFKAN